MGVLKPPEGNTHLLDGVALVEMEAALHADARPPLQGTEHQPACVPMHCRKRNSQQGQPGGQVQVQLGRRDSPVLWGKLGMSL